MTLLKTFAVAAGLAAVATASSAAARISDVDYINANRCQALMESSALGAVDATAMTAFLKTEGRSRADMVASMARKAYDKAGRQAASANEETKARLIAERDGRCQAYLQNTRG